jgi:hypothetical protein
MNVRVFCRDSMIRTLGRFRIVTLHSGLASFMVGKVVDDVSCPSRSLTVTIDLGRANTARDGAGWAVTYARIIVEPRGAGLW